MRFCGILYQPTETASESAYRILHACTCSSPAITIGAHDSFRRPRIFCLTSHVNCLPNFPTLCCSDCDESSSVSSSVPARQQQQQGSQHILHDLCFITTAAFQTRRGGEPTKATSVWENDGCKSRTKFKGKMSDSNPMDLPMKWRCVVDDMRAAASSLYAMRRNG